MGNPLQRGKRKEGAKRPEGHERKRVPHGLGSLNTRQAMPEVKNEAERQPFNRTFQKNGQTAGTYPSNPGAFADRLLNLPTLM
jgi:hypothetical protein